MDFIDLASDYKTFINIFLYISNLSNEGEQWTQSKAGKTFWLMLADGSGAFKAIASGRKAGNGESERS